VTAPLDGVRVVEVAVGVSDLGLGHAGGVPGRLLADLGAAVTRIVGPTSPAIDADVPWGRVWHRGKHLVRTDDVDEIRSLLAGADVAFVYGDIEGVSYEQVAASNPTIVYARCREDFSLLVEARAGFCSQLAAHRPGPMLVDVRASTSGAAFLLTASALALLRRRALTGTGGWSDTSLYDGMLATLGCMIGRSERAAPKIESYWAQGSFFPNFLYRCADGELLQIWFGGKGMYAKVIEVLGDEPSVEGYYAEQMSGLLNARAERWKSVFVTEPREVWIERLRGAGAACEPVLGPGEALADPHLAEVGLAVSDGDDIVVGPPIGITALRPAVDPVSAPRGPRLLDGVRVVDFSAFVAGPLAAQVLADLGADVVKVEPPEGEAMRAAAYAVAACQRGKRSVALDITDPAARPVVEALLRDADVVLHNFRVGVAERLGIDAGSVAAINPAAVHCHASAFGSTGRRAAYPGNDALMQAVTGFERANGGEGNDPIAATWIPIDMSGGWVAACGILAGLCARATTGRGQRVDTSLLGAGMLLHSGVFERDGEIVRGPALGADQTGYGPGYRLYQCAGDTWVAVVVPDADAWASLDVPGEYAPLRHGEVEEMLSRRFATATAADWVPRLRAIGVLAEVVDELDRDGFRRRILDDPANRELGRAVAYDTDDWGRFEQIGPLLRCGPDAGGGPSLHLPGVGEHTIEVLTELGFGEDEIEALRDKGIARQR
jgi:crotonobetainyl-CoA:carnitine CoA-transferase CaiB-like acyl-CoA transferase